MLSNNWYSSSCEQDDIEGPESLCVFVLLMINKKYLIGEFLKFSNNTKRKFSSEYFLVYWILLKILFLKERKARISSWDSTGDIILLSNETSILFISKNFSGRFVDIFLNEILWLFGLGNNQECVKTWRKVDLLRIRKIEICTSINEKLFWNEKKG